MMSTAVAGSPPSPQEELTVIPSNTQPPLALPAPPVVVASTNPRRLPPPCWSPDETVALIDAYREKWYSLRRGNLKANHWQEVADAVSARCPAASPPKTAVQCRHKMEKLRKRYRTEIQRARSMPVSRFTSSWVHFKRMDAMEKGPQAAKPDYASDNSNGEDNDDEDEDDDDNNINNNNNVNVNVNSNNQGFYQDSYKNGAAAFVNTRSIHKLYNRNGMPNIAPNIVNISGGGGGGGVPGAASGFRIRIPTGVSIAQPGPRFYPKVEQQQHQKYGGNVNLGGNSVPKVNYGGGSGMGSSRVVRGQAEEVAAAAAAAVAVGRKRDREPMEEMVAAIKVLGDGFVRVEQMKMEMAREIETMRMEMEMKRTEMILESQQRIVEAFAKAFAEKKKKPKRVSSPDS